MKPHERKIAEEVRRIYRAQIYIDLLNDKVTQETFCYFTGGIFSNRRAYHPLDMWDKIK